MKKTAILISILFTVIAPCLKAADGGRWINVSVHENNGGTDVELHLPFDLIMSVIRGIDVEGFDAGKIDLEIEDMDIDWISIMAGIHDAPDGEFVRVKADDGQVEISKKNGTVYIHASEIGGDNAVADISMPVTLLAAFSIDDENRIDIAAMLSSLADLPSGELVRVTSDEANVRIWVE
jgi:hypothetical protein